MSFPFAVGWHWLDEKHQSHRCLLCTDHTEQSRHELRFRSGLPLCWSFPALLIVLKHASPLPADFSNITAVSSGQKCDKIRPSKSGWDREVLDDFAVHWHTRVQFCILIDTYSHAVWTCNRLYFLKIICSTEGKERTWNHKWFDNTNASMSLNRNPLSIFLT